MTYTRMEFLKGAVAAGKSQADSHTKFGAGGFLSKNKRRREKRQSLRKKPLREIVPRKKSLKKRILRKKSLKKRIPRKKSLKKRVLRKKSLKTKDILRAGASRRENCPNII